MTNNVICNFIQGTVVSQELPVHSDTVGKQVDFMITGNIIFSWPRMTQEIEILR